MKSTSLKIRSFNRGGAFEIMLPSGKVVLIDPFFSCRPFDGGQTREDVTGADYILLTHSHFDHDIDVGYFVSKFNSKVFCGVFSAEEVMKFHNIPYDNLFPVWPGQKISLDDFTLEAWQAKHNPNGGLSFDPNLDLTSRFGIPGHSRCDQLGSYESLDYMITTPNHFSILMASGRVIGNDIFDICREKHPNVLFRQSGVRNATKEEGSLFGGQQVSAEELAKLFVRYKAQIIFPFHQDAFSHMWGLEKTNEYLNEVAREVQKLDPGAMFINPEEWKWYNVGIDVSEE
jgi:hypothetical protein